MNRKKLIIIIVIFININLVFSETILKPVKVQSIKIQKDIINMKPNETEVIHLEIEPKYSSYNEISWESSNENVVSVKDGIISSFSVGEAYIFINCDEKNAKVLVKVKEQKQFQDTIWYHLLISLGPILIAIISLIFGYRDSKVRKRKEIIEKIQDKLISLLNILYDIEEKATDAVDCTENNLRILRDSINKLICDTNKTEIYISLMAELFNKGKLWDFYDINEYIYGSFQDQILEIFSERKRFLDNKKQEDNNKVETIEKLSKVLAEANHKIVRYFLKIS